MKKVYLFAMLSIILAACSSETPNSSAYDEETKLIAEEFDLEELAFSFLLNKEEPWAPNEMRVAIIDQEKYKDLQIVARHNRSEKEVDYFTIHIRGFKGKGSYKIAGSDYKMAWYFNLNNQELVNSDESTLEITDYDEAKGVISGHFSGTIYSPHKPKTGNQYTLNITNGVINNLKINYEEDIISNAKNPAN